MIRKHQLVLKEKSRTEMPKVLIASSECAPLSKTGGLADVVGALPKSFAKLGIDARVITPYHKCIKQKYFGQTEHICNFTVNLGWRQQYVGIEKLVVDDVVVYLVDNEYYFNGDTLYRGGDAEIEQYAYFSRAILEAIPLLDFQPEILHCNDWQTGIIPFLVKTQYMFRPQGELKTLLTIHNMAFQGVTGFGFLSSLLGIDSKYMNDGCLEFHGAANMMKAGLFYADKVNTVSPTYAKELCTPQFGAKLEGVINCITYKLSGIINGLDYKVFNPWTDPTIPFHYTAGRLAGKVKCKKALCEKMGLEIDDETPIIAMVTRMTDQKGFDLVIQALDRIVDMGAAFVLLGSGNAHYEHEMRLAEERNKGRVVSYIGYNAELANQIYAGSDFYLMPSLFEPCGLSQMIAMRYGSSPIVRATGGLSDTVSHFDGENGTGFVFNDYDVNGLLWAVGQAVETYKDKEKMAKLVQNAMRSDFSFAGSAETYADLYLEMI